jgi:hypothetical protein
MGEKAGVTIGRIGSASGILTEAIASINFWLYTRTARQFGAFHVCLERTYRYLIAYQIAKETGVNRSDTLRDLACIMANAPMITRQDIEGGTEKWVGGKSTGSREQGGTSRTTV